MPQLWQLASTQVAVVIRTLSYMQQRLCTCGTAFGLSEGSDQAQGERQQGTTALLTVLLGPCQVAVFSM